MIRAIGFIMILSGASCAGILQAAAVKREHRICESLCLGLAWMKNSITYELSSLEDTLRGAAGLMIPVLGRLFLSLADAINREPAVSLPAAAKRYFAAVPEFRGDVETILFDLLRMLGRHDAAAQVNAIELAEKRVGAVLSQMEKDKKQRCRSYGTLWTCAGLALAVILL